MKQELYRQNEFPCVKSLSRHLLTVFLFAIVPLVRGADLPAPFVVDLPFQANAATPVWLGHPEMPNTTFATLNLPIQPPDPAATLLVTVFFQEKEGGFLRISWQGAETAQILVDNFYEGIGMANQRSLLVAPDTMQNGGTLNFQCSGATLGIQRIKLEWLASQNGLVSPQVQDLLITPATGTTVPAPTANGLPQQPADATWQNQVVNVPVADLPQRIEQGVEFSVQLDNVPAAARFALKEAGLSFGKHLVVWINRQRAGTITPQVPDLADEGFLATGDPAGGYVGWREGSFYVPVAFLKTGTNAIQFSVEDEIPSTDSSSATATPPPVEPLALKNVILQLSYPQSLTEPATPPSTTVSDKAPASAEPTGAIPAPDSPTPSSPSSPAPTTLP